MEKMSAQDITGFKEVKLFSLNEGERIKEFMVLTSEVWISVHELRSSGVW